MVQGRQIWMTKREKLTDSIPDLAPAHCNITVINLTIYVIIIYS